MQSKATRPGEGFPTLATDEFARAIAIAIAIPVVPVVRAVAAAAAATAAAAAAAPTSQVDKIDPLPTNLTNFGLIALSIYLNKELLRLRGRVARIAQ